ncbi:MAG: STAS domain-containing protein [Clostridia bacterium]|nr:STAS domain-containing protein [Clostridia bacterium]
MRLRYKKQKETLTVFLEGEIDQNNAGEIRGAIDRLLCDATIELLVFDLRQVSFMDSSGIGILLGRYRLMTARGGRIAIREPRENIVRILKIAGIYKIAEECGGTLK